MKTNEQKDWINNKFKKQNAGITLIALVVTIIVILLLAGITIAMLTGENGIITQAGNAKEELDKVSALEEVQLEVLGSFDKHGELDMEKVASNVSKNLGATSNSFGEELVVKYGNYEFLVDEEGNVTIFDNSVTTANAPELDDGMIPVYYNGTNWVICSEDDTNWYDYDSKQWANIMLSDGRYDTTAEAGTVVSNDELGSMFVWIPRYAYKITSGYHSSTTGTIEVVWLSGTSYNYIDSNGDIQTAYNGNNGTTITSSGYSDYVAHPCFTNGSQNYTKYGTANFQNGEWDTEIAGIWVSKFEAGYALETNTYESSLGTDSNSIEYPVFKGQRYSYNYINIENIYKVSQSISASENPYGLSTTSNSHQIKDSEWGAVAYLTQSTYGRNSEVYINNVSLAGAKIGSRSDIYAITGYAGTSTSVGTNTGDADTTIGDTIVGDKTSYAWYTENGMNASTTGNIYGIYDMSGGCWEYTASVIPSGHSNISIYGGTTFSNATESSKYMTLYPVGESTLSDTSIHKSYSAWSKIFGDAMYETSSGAGTDSPNSSWYNDRSDEAPSTDEPFFVRGGCWGDGSGAGTFAFADVAGLGFNYCSYRLVLVVE